MYLDRKLAKKLLTDEIKKEGKNLVRAELQLKGDEYWNSETIWENGKNKRSAHKCYYGSYWATPVIRFYYKDGKELALDCYSDESIKE